MATILSVNFDTLSRETKRVSSICRKRLLVAVITQSIRDVYSSEVKIRNDAVKWLASDRAVHYATLAGMEPDVFAHGVKRHIERVEGETQKNIKKPLHRLDDCDNLSLNEYQKPSNGTQVAANRN